MRVPDETTRISRIVGGVLLVTVGAVLLLQELNYFWVGPIWRFWPLFLVWGGATRLLAPRGRESRSSGAIFLALGLVFQAEQLGLLRRSLGDLWPILLVAVGLALIFESFSSSRDRRPAPPGSAGEGASS